jgi:hypothetical protein
MKPSRRATTPGLIVAMALPLAAPVAPAHADDDDSRQWRSGAEPTRRMAAAARGTPAPDQWAASLGYLLATLGRDGPQPAPARRPHGAAMSGSFVSFLIES